VPGTKNSKNEKISGPATKIVIKGVRGGEEKLYSERLAG
jgi:hypothetical protein